jgi:hypothetical protein
MHTRETVPLTSVLVLRSNTVITERSCLSQPYSVCISPDILPFISVYGQVFRSTTRYRTPQGGLERDLQQMRLQSSAS